MSTLTMDHSLMPRSVWSGDSKVLQHPADLFTSVVVTRSIPAGTSFGPCVLQNTFYDTIAFIALKSSDKTNKSYVFRVDPEAMRNSSLVLSWLRLVAAARNPGEQNTEAFLKAGQLYVRTVRDVQPEEELLVWYDQELSHLLGFTDMRRGASQELKCGRCGQVFKNEFPFLSHCRFLCAQVKSDNWSQRDIYEQNKLAAAEIRRPRRVTDFHNIARDLEHKKSPSNTSGTSADAVIYPKRRKYEDTPCAKGRKTVLLEKTNISNDDNISTQLNKGPGYELLQETGNASSSSSSAGKLKADKSSSKPDHLGCTKNFAEETFTHERKMEARSKEEEEAAESSSTSSARRSNSSAFSLVRSSSHGDQKSAFCKPSKRTSPMQLSNPPTATAPSRHIDDMQAVLGYNNLMASNILSAELQQQQSVTVPSQVALNNHYHYAPQHWSRNIGVQLQTAATTPSLAILPPTFNSFGVSVQNWCAKCNLSFRMTSDLVFHMRSHHKKEFAAESQVRKRREEKLTCPICHEYFRERHHLSRHMTSHN